jgi:ribosomal protein S27AE
MKSGICPKCGSSEIYSGASLPSYAKMGSYWANTIPVTLWTLAPLDNYICANCGFMESYVADPAKRAMIARKWPRVGEIGEIEQIAAPAAPAAAVGGSCPACGNAVKKDWRACPYCGQPLV